MEIIDIEGLPGRFYTGSMSQKPRHPDLNQLAASIVERATQDTPPVETSLKDPAAVALGRKGGLKGGKARAAKLSANKRKSIAKKAAQARWGKKSPQK